MLWLPLFIFSKGRLRFLEGGACAMAQWHNGQSKTGSWDIAPVNFRSLTLKSAHLSAFGPNEESKTTTVLVIASYSQK